MSEDRRISDIIPWVEASTIIGGVLVAAIATSAVSLYRIDSIEDKVDNLVTAVENIDVIRSDINHLKDNNRQTQQIFLKFSESVDKLAIAVAKLEGKNYGSERGN
jgi:FtsZ-binding cell division protein ZapB